MVPGAAGWLWDGDGLQTMQEFPSAHANAFFPFLPLPLHKPHAAFFLSPGQTWRTVCSKLTARGKSHRSVPASLTFDLYLCSSTHANAASLPSAACSCDPLGSVLSGSSPLCDPSSGECTCKPGVGGARCDRCMLGYWGLHEYGCRPCGCAGDCDRYTGDCVSG